MIDEKKLIKELSRNSIFKKVTVGEETVYDIIDRLLKVGEWIPCSEQPEPKEDGDYLISGRWLRSGRKVVSEAEYIGEWKVVNNFIIEAWQPLPESYGGEVHA